MLIVKLQMQHGAISMTLQLPDEIYMTPVWSCSASNGYCLRSCCTLCGNNFFVPWQYINFMSQQATTGSLCQAKQCLIGFWSMATPPEACFHLLFFFQLHLERNGGDYIPPAVSRWFYPRGLWEYATDSHSPCCPVWLLANPELLLQRLFVTPLLRQAQVQRELW